MFYFRFEMINLVPLMSTYVLYVYMQIAFYIYLFAYISRFVVRNVNHEKKIHTPKNKPDQ